MTSHNDEHKNTNERIEEVRRWPVRVGGLLLIVQAVAAMVVSYRMGAQDGFFDQLSDDFHSPGVVVGFSATGLFVLLSVLALGAGIGFLFVRRGAWFAAMVLQALTLAATLFYHFNNGPTLVYALMFFASAMVFFINSRPVRNALHGDLSSPGELGNG